MRGTKIILTAVMAMLLASGCNIHDGETAIMVNDIAIKKGDIDKAISMQIKNSPFAKMGISVKSSDNDFLYLITKDRVVNELIVRALIDQECKNRGITVSDDERELALEDLMSKMGSKDRFYEALKQRGISKDKFAKDFAEELKIRKLAHQISPKEITVADARKYYNANISKFKNPEKVRASHILISTNAQEIEKAVRNDKANKKLSDDEIRGKIDLELATRKSKADELLKEVLKDKKQFAKLARENSEDKGSSEMSGDLGFFAATDMVPEFSTAAFHTKVGTVYPKVVQTMYGYHIIYVTDRKAAGVSPFEAVQYEIINYLQANKEISVINNLIEGLKKNAEIKFVDKNYDPRDIKQNLQKKVMEQTLEPAAQPAAQK
ncbi:peptidylprolyl isomerase [bacterium]|nr:peptidylprolyl isomerase [bacterium]